MGKIILTLLVVSVWVVAMDFNFAAGRVNVEATSPEITLDRLSSSVNNSQYTFEEKRYSYDSPIMTIEDDKRIYYVDFSPNADMFVSSAKDDYVKLWDTKSGKIIKKIHTDTKKEKQVLFHPSGKYIAFEDYVNGEKKIKLVDISTDKIIRQFDGESPFSFSNDGTMIAFSINNGGRRWTSYVKVANVSTGQILHKFPTLGGHMSSIAFSPYKSTFSAGSFTFTGNFNAFQGNAGLFDYKTGKTISVLENRGVSATTFSSDGLFLVTGSYTGRIKLYNGLTGKFTKEIIFGKNDTMYKIDAVSFAYGSSLLAISDTKPYSKHVKILDIKSGKVFKKLFTLDKYASIKFAKFSQNGNLLIACGDKIRIWDTTRYNKQVATQIYNSIDKSDYIALYEFTKKFYNKFDIVQQTYSDIYKAVTKEDTLEAYEWYVSMFKKTIYNEHLIKEHIDGYEWYQNHFGSSASSELKTVMEKLNALRQAKYAKEYEAVKKENSMGIFGAYASSHVDPKADNIVEAIAQMHKLAFAKVKEINTLSAYNTFIFAYPYADEVDEANKLAYELEKEQYTDIGLMGFLGKDEKMNKQARKLLIKAKKILEGTVPDDNLAGRNSIGVYMVVDRMYRLAQTEFFDTDAVLSLMESDRLKRFQNKYKRKLDERTYGIKRLESSHPEDELELRSESEMYIFNDAPNIESAMKKFDKIENKKAKDFYEPINKKAQKEYEKRRLFIKSKKEDFDKFYEKSISEYKPKIVKPESIDLSDIASENNEKLKSKILTVIKNGSNRLNYPMGEMPPRMATEKDAEDIAEYMIKGMKGNRPEAFSGCTSCHGEDGQGMNGMSPNLLKFIEQKKEIKPKADYVLNAEKSLDTNNVNTQESTQPKQQISTKKEPKQIDLSNDSMKVSVAYTKIGDFLEFDVTASNFGGDAKGGISISFPNIKDKNKIVNAEGMFGMTVDIYPIKSKIWNRKLKKQITSEDILLEGWSKKWGQNELKSMKFTINIKDLNEVKMRMRAILVKNKNELILPIDGESDQQGYPVKSIAIDVTKIEDLSIKLQKLEDSCNDGNGEACGNLGGKYLSAKGVNSDNEKAVRLYKKSCDNGYAQGCFMLGSLYQSGKRVGQDDIKARSFYKKAANFGDSRGYVELGIIYEEGKGVKQDYIKAAELYNKACNAGWTSVCVKLGVLYESGKGVEQNYVKAKELYKKACDRKYVKGCEKLKNIPIQMQTSSTKITNYSHPDDEPKGLYIVKLAVNNQQKTYRLYCPKKMVRDITNNTYGKSRSIEEEDSITFGDNMVLRKAYKQICVKNNISTTSQIPQQTTTPVFVKHQIKGKVRGISRNGDGFIAIRSGPGLTYEMIDKFYQNGEKVIVADKKGKWKGVIYGNSNCSKGLSKQKAQAYRGACKTGWVYGRYVKLVAE